MNELEKKVLQNIGESTSSPDVFTDTDAGMAPIRDSINDAIQEIAIVSGSISREYHVPLVNGQTFYRLKFTDGYFGWVKDAWLTNKKRKLEQTSFLRLAKENPRWLLDNGPPEQYMQVGEDILGFYRKPTDSGDIVQLQVMLIPKRYVRDTDRVMVNSAFEWAVAHYATSEYWISRGDAKEAKFWMAKYLELVGINKTYPMAAERFRQYRTEKAYWDL